MITVTGYCDRKVVEIFRVESIFEAHEVQFGAPDKEQFLLTSTDPIDNLALQALHYQVALRNV